MPHFKEVKPDDIEHFNRRARGAVDGVHVSKEFRVPFPQQP